MYKLHDYQNTAYKFAMNRLYVGDDQGAGLFLDPGLGKTLITLHLLQQLKTLGEIDRVLVVAPLRVCRLVWGQEIRKWGFNFDTNMLCQRVTKGLKNSGPFIDLINPESLHHLVGIGRWDMIVVDESTKFKNWTCKRMKAMRKMLPDFRKRLILTGTPAPNSLADLHGQAYIIDDGVALGRNVTVFRSMYMYQAGWQGRQWMLKPGTHGPIHDQLAPMCIRLDAETCLDMPELSTHRVDCELPPSVRGKYKQLKRELLAQLDSGTIFAQNAASAYMKMRQFANGRMFDEEKAVHFVHKEKQEALKEVVGELGGKPVMVFYQFKHDADAIREKFPKCPLLNGATKPNAAEKMVNDWNAGKTHVFGIQNQAASHGLNMQGAGNDVVYYGMGDRPEDYIQSFRRLYRQGVKGREVRIHRILTRGTVDDIIEGRIDGKGTTQREFCNRLRDHARTS